MSKQAFPTQSPTPRTSRPASAFWRAGVKSVGRVLMLHDAFSPTDRRVLLNAGLKPGMIVADFGCGIGAMTRMLAGIVGPTGTVIGIDSNECQLVHAGNLCLETGITNVLLWKAETSNTQFPADTCDAVYCRSLLIHLPDPDACVRGILRVLKPGGTINRRRG